MKHTPIILLTLLLGLTFFSCKKQEQETLTPKITEDKVEATATTATFTWTVDWPGKLISVVEVSENEDMSNSKKYGPEIETENHNFTVTVSDLKAVTKYYYRFWVWNRYYEDNKFVMEGGDFATVETGVLNGVFSVNQSKKVRFSKGNLQYQASTNIWRFAKNQWDYVGEANENISQIYSGWIDLFGWGTSGWDNGNEYYQPYDTQNNGNSSQGYGYGPTDGTSYTINLTGTYANDDWGVRNPISNGGGQAGQWRTLSKEEWGYVFDTRTTDSGIRFAKANVNDVNGVILLPDDWNSNYYGLNETNTIDASFTSNTVTASEWSLLEMLGAVFLPAAGIRSGTMVGIVGGYGGYWSASCSGSSSAYDVGFSDFGLGPQGDDLRYEGLSVRLVRSAQ